MTGAFHLILGCMFSGKTSELIRRYQRHVLGGKRCLMVKYARDTRYSANAVATHDGVSIHGVRCLLLADVDRYVVESDVVCIDEVQFYKDAPMWCDKWANDGKVVIACGLNGMFNREPFPVVSQLIPLVEDITFLTAICRETGDEAVYSQRLTDETEEQIIGGAETYRAADRTTYFAKN